MRSRVLPPSPSLTPYSALLSRSPSHSPTALTPSLHLFRAYSRDRLPLTASNRQPPPGLSYSPSTPKQFLPSFINEPQSPHTPTSLHPAFALVQSEIRCRKTDMSPRASDLLMSEARAKRRTAHNPIQRDVASLSTRELEDAENLVNQALLSVTVKLLQLLSDHTIASKELERTLFALLILCAEVDRDIEVGANCQVMSSRAWPAVRRYLQSPGQVVQAIRKIKPGIESGKIGKRAIQRAADAIFQVSESRLREEKGGNVGSALYHLIRSLVDYSKVWDRLPLGSKPLKRPISSPAPLWKSAVRTLKHPESPPSLSTKTTLCSTDSHPSEVAEGPCLSLELDRHFQHLLLEKLSSKEGSSDLLEREKVIAQFRQWIKTLELKGEEAATTVTCFLSSLREGLYEAELQRAVKLIRLQARRQEKRVDLV